MTLPAILWVDGDTQHAVAARRLMAVRHPGWRVVNSPTVDAARAPLASHAWDAVVWCLKPSVQELPDMSQLCAGRSVLLCLDASQEALAARAFRSGLADYVMRVDDEGAHLPELLERLSALLQRGSDDDRRAPPQDVLAVLQKERAALRPLWPA